MPNSEARNQQVQFTFAVPSLQIQTRDTGGKLVYKLSTLVRSNRSFLLQRFLLSQGSCVLGHVRILCPLRFERRVRERKQQD